MSPFTGLVILDNNCVVNFYLANCLERILTLWPFRVFVVPSRVFLEASHWREHGEDVCRILTKLSSARTIELVSIDENSEQELDAYARMRLLGPHLGLGESESIAMAVNRNYIVATDDRVARDRCHEVFPSVKTVTTDQVLRMAAQDGLLTESDRIAMWRVIEARRNAR